MRVILIHNTGAGDSLYNRDSLLALIRKHGHEVAYFAATDAWQSSVKPPVDVVVAAGGDGTVEDVARHLAGSGIPIGVLPLGTANNVASALGIAATPVPELVASWTQAERRVFDTGCLAAQHETFRFVESVGVGLLAESIAEITQGNAGYVDRLDDAEARMDAAIEVLRATLRRLEPTHMDLVVDGQELSGDYLLVEVMNFGCAGPNLCLVPEAVHSDGLFDVVLADVSHRTQLMDELPLYRRGHHPSTPLPVHPASRLVLNAKELRLHLDDQLRACPGPVELTVEPGSLTFLV